ncbi:hypothetical protein Pcinc_009360 [Petrolisthes cinctipes]|uniref:Uncharacterized protein n=1 Tax=Petrolisthes cinctipes TaxID=88211 RepID=A0AAE1G745_PETCI|nr:hypothetical protein Pcinc_009360 [Petrolisthes cinctipes]
MLMDLLSAHDYCVPYGRTLLIENAPANSIVKKHPRVPSLYVPLFLKKSAFVFFAVDKTDFSEDTAVWKGTTHWTITVVYQKAEVPGEPVAPPLKIGDAQSLSTIPYHADMLHCDKPKPQLAKRTHHFVTSKRISGS